MSSGCSPGIEVQCSKDLGHTCLDGNAAFCRRENVPNTICVIRASTLLISLPTGQGENHDVYISRRTTTTKDSSMLQEC